MGAAGGGGGGRGDTGNNAPTVTRTRQRPLSREEVDASFARDRGQPSVTRNRQTPLSPSEINASLSGRAPTITSRTETPLGKSELGGNLGRGGEGGVPLFLTPNGLLIPSSTTSTNEEEETGSTVDGKPDQSGIQPKRRAASLLTLGLADTTRKTLLGR